MSMSGSNSCASCQQDFNDNDKFATCDSCHIAVHANERCASLSLTEVRAILLQKRSLAFFCQECRSAFKSVPLLIRQINDLKLEVLELKKEVNTLKEQKSLGTEDIYHEVQDRLSRANNFIIFNAEEQKSDILSERVEADKKLTDKVLEQLGCGNVSNNIVKVVRVGKVSHNKTRPVKVICDNSQLVKSILKSKAALYSTNYRVSADLAILQQKQMKVAKTELSRRKQAGESNLTIRTRNGIPVVMSIDGNPKNQ